jgi:uroporphyrinogen III methyltransferase/synthase
LKAIRGACIGPVTADTARKQGIPVVLEASPHSIEGLVSAIESHFQAKDTT